MRNAVAAFCLSSLVAGAASPAARAAEADARPPDRLTLTGNGARLIDADENGGGGSLNWLHYFTPDVLFGLGAEHQTIADSKWTFGSIRGALGRGEASSRFTVYAELHYGEGDDAGRDFDYAVAVLGFSQALTGNFSVQLEGRQIDIDTSHGNLPKLGITYLWTPRLVTTLSYAHSVGGNLGTRLATLRIDHYGQHVNWLLGGAFGDADPNVVNLQPGVSAPSQDLQQGFAGIGRTFSRGEILLLGDYLQLGDSEKVTVTLSFTAYLGSRGRAP